MAGTLTRTMIIPLRNTPMQLMIAKAHQLPSLPMITKVTPTPEDMVTQSLLDTETPIS